MKILGAWPWGMKSYPENERRGVHLAGRKGGYQSDIWQRNYNSPNYNVS